MTLQDGAAISTILTLILYIIVERDKLTNTFGMQRSTKIQTNSTAVQQNSRESIRQILRWAIAGAAIVNIPIIIPLVFVYIEGGSNISFSVRGFLAFVYFGAVCGILARIAYITAKRVFESQKQEVINWGRSGNLWWLSNDLITTLNRINDPEATKIEIDHYLLKCHHHALKVAFDESLVARLKNLKTEARNYSQSDWTDTKRREYTQALISIMNDAGRMAEQKQSDFDPGPSLI